MTPYTGIKAYEYTADVKYFYSVQGVSGRNCRIIQSLKLQSDRLAGGNILSAKNTVYGNVARSQSGLAKLHPATYGAENGRDGVRAKLDSMLHIFQRPNFLERYLADDDHSP